jgi:hypothetical protein
MTPFNGNYVLLGLLKSNNFVSLDDVIYESGESDLSLVSKHLLTCIDDVSDKQGFVEYVDIRNQGWMLLLPIKH